MSRAILQSTEKGTKANKLKSFKVIDEKNKTIEVFRTKRSAIEFIKQKGGLFDLKIVDNE